MTRLPISELNDNLRTMADEIVRYTNLTHQSTLEKPNEEELAKLDARLEEAEKTEGESEISDALKARANYLTRIGDKVRLSSFAL